MKISSTTYVIVFITAVLLLMCAGLFVVWLLPMSAEKLDVHFNPKQEMLECSQNDITTFELHSITFVIVDTQSHPLTDMRIEIGYGNTTMYNTTGIDGSCSFVLEGSTRHTVIIENVHLEREKRFVLYPVNSCYLIVLEKERGRS